MREAQLVLENDAAVVQALSLICQGVEGIGEILRELEVRAHAEECRMLEMEEDEALWWMVDEGRREVFGGAARRGLQPLLTLAVAALVQLPCESLSFQATLLPVCCEVGPPTLDPGLGCGKGVTPFGWSGLVMLFETFP